MSPVADAAGATRRAIQQAFVGLQEFRSVGQTSRPAQNASSSCLIPLLRPNDGRPGRRTTMSPNLETPRPVVGTLSRVDGGQHPRQPGPLELPSRRPHVGLADELSECCSIASPRPPAPDSGEAVLQWQSELRGPAVGAAGAIHGVSKVGQPVLLKLRPRRPRAPPGQVFAEVLVDAVLGPDRRVPRRMRDEAHAYLQSPALGAARARYRITKRFRSVALELPIGRPLHSASQKSTQVFTNPVFGPDGPSTVSGVRVLGGGKRLHAQNVAPARLTSPRRTASHGDELSDARCLTAL